MELMIAEKVKKYRRERDMTQEALAQALGVAPQSVSKWECGEGYPDITLLPAIANFFEITVDELIGNPGRGTDMIRLYRRLPGNSKHLIDWHIKHQKFVNEEHSKQRTISVMDPLCIHNGNLKLTNDYQQVDISGIHRENLHKVFFGIRLPCEHYLPHYMQGDILLIANDRNPLPCENTVIIVNGNICIVKQKIENSVINYYSIRDGGFRSSSHDSIEVLGYIAEVMEYTPTR